MKKLFCALIGALAIGAAIPSAEAAPLQAAVFHPDDTAARVQTVQYDSHFRPRHYYRRHQRYYRANRHAYARSRAYHRHGVPYRRY